MEQDEAVISFIVNEWGRPGLAKLNGADFCGLDSLLDATGKWSVGIVNGQRVSTYFELTLPQSPYKKLDFDVLLSGLSLDKSHIWFPSVKRGEKLKISHESTILGKNKNNEIEVSFIYSRDLDSISGVKFLAGSIKYCKKLIYIIRQQVNNSSLGYIGGPERFYATIRKKDIEDMQILIPHYL